MFVSFPDRHHKSVVATTYLNINSNNLEGLVLTQVPPNLNDCNSDCFKCIQRLHKSFFFDELEMKLIDLIPYDLLTLYLLLSAVTILFYHIPHYYYLT